MPGRIYNLILISISMCLILRRSPNPTPYTLNPKPLLPLSDFNLHVLDLEADKEKVDLANHDILEVIL